MEYLLEREDETYALTVSTEKKMLVADSLAMMFGLAGTGLALYEYELFYDFSSTYITNGVLVSNGNTYLKTEPDKNFYIRIFISILTALLCLMIYYRYHLYLKIQQYRRNLDSFDTLKSSELHIPLLLEILVCIIHAPPRVNYAFQLTQYEGN